MGKRKLDSIKKIEDFKVRLITQRKRAIGLLKKAIEFSELCD